MANEGGVFYYGASDLDVEVLIAGFTVRCKDIVAEPRELEDVSIKGLEVEVSPGTAYSASVSWVASCRLKTSYEALLKIPVHTHLFIHCLVIFLACSIYCPKQSILCLLFPLIVYFFGHLLFIQAAYFFCLTISLLLINLGIRHCESSSTITLTKPIVLPGPCIKALILPYLNWKYLTWHIPNMHFTFSLALSLRESIISSFNLDYL